MRSHYLLSFGLITTLSFSALADGLADQLAIVVGKSSPTDSLTSAELLKVFRAEKGKDSGGGKYIIIMQEAGQPAREAALRGIYKMSDAEYNKFFLQATFTGAVQAAPKALSAAAVKHFVADTPGAIGYLRADEVDDKLKVVKIDGHAPGEPGYPLSMK